LENNSLIYDGDCPFCSRYAQLARIREALGPLRLINAREHPDLVRQLAEKGYDLDKGMVLQTGEKIYFGDECLNALALMSTRSGVFNTLTGAVFRSKKVSRWVYPVLRCGRNVILRILGRKKINA
jgi:predicted DCC family thiol-disulfide oxidoreductase YuxK